jgi:hypothetical protein
MVDGEDVGQDWSVDSFEGQEAPRLYRRVVGPPSGWTVGRIY